MHPLLVQLVELFQCGSRAVISDGIAHGLVPTEIWQVQEVARVATVNQDFSLFRKYLAACFTQEGGAGFEKPLHLSSGYRFFGEQKDMRATRLAAAHNHWKLQASDLFYEANVVQWILVNVNTAPDTGVICPDRDNSQTRFSAFKVLGPQVVSRWLAHHDGLAGLLPVSPG